MQGLGEGPVLDSTIKYAVGIGPLRLEDRPAARRGHRLRNAVSGVLLPLRGRSMVHDLARLAERRNLR